MNSGKITRDNGRFRQIIEGQIKKNLKKYVTSQEMIGKKGKEYVSIPLPRIDLPHFKYGRNQKNGVGQGAGEEGDAIFVDPNGDGSLGEAGDEPGRHLREVDVKLEDLMRILGEELELPNIRPKTTADIESVYRKYSSIRRTGPDSLRHFKRTYKEALKRAISSGEIDPDNLPRNFSVVPARPDFRYRSFKDIPKPITNVVLFLLGDVSGSMDENKKAIMRQTAFWVEGWLKYQYKTIKNVHIVHDVNAKEVSEGLFYSLNTSGGTKISSALILCRRLIDSMYSPIDYNIYILQFSDGDNYGNSDNKECKRVLEEQLLDKCNNYFYAQVGYSDGGYYEFLMENFEDDERIVLEHIPDMEDIIDAIKAYFGKGK